jgi:hypothetical protein
MHGHRQQVDDGGRFAGRHDSPFRYFPVQPRHGLGLGTHIEREGREWGHLSGRFRFDVHLSEPNTRLPVQLANRCAPFGEEQAGHDLFDESLEILAGRARGDVQPLNPALGKPERPLPASQLVQQLALVLDLAIPEREGGEGILPKEHGECRLELL